MDRRKFLQTITQNSLILIGTPFLGHAALAADSSCSSEQTMSSGVTTFGYYQGLQPSQTRSPNRTDGTKHNMPCIPITDIEAAEDRVYTFWHGHNGVSHRFTVTHDDFLRLQTGEVIEVYTDIVSGHRHALKIDPNLAC